MISQPYTAAFHNLLTAYFNLSELQQLAFVLGVEWEELAGDTRSDKTRSLVLWLARNGRLADLITLTREQRSHITWPDPPPPDQQVAAEGGIHFHALPTATPWQLPSRVDHFINRQAEITRLKADLQPGQVIALCGPGGIGKSSLIAEALHQLDENKELTERFPDGIIYHNFDREAQAVLAQEHIAHSFGIDIRPTSSTAAQRALSGKQALLILESTENADDLQQVLQVRGQCAALITSRRRADAQSQRQDVKPLPQAEAVTLLQKWGGNRVPDETIAAHICDIVGNLPLAVRLVGRYLAQQEEDAVDYLEWLQESPIQALSYGDRKEESIEHLLQKSLKQVNQPTQDALSVIGWLAMQPFEREVIAAALDQKPIAVGRLLGELVNYGLLERVGNAYQVTHVLVHTYAQRRLNLLETHQNNLAEYYLNLTRQLTRLGPEGYKELDHEHAHLMALLQHLISHSLWLLAIKLVALPTLTG
ncbi:MAG: hypothetical protein KC421_18730, partial [Anaerolineales bacterium]|nr:hypothetical protein [Anaerolineales bacterium]